MPQKATDEKKEIADVYDDILAYCIIGQISKSSLVSIGNKDKVGPVPTTKELSKAQTSYMLCENLEELLKEDGTMTINDAGLLCRKAPVDRTIQISVPER